jgi:hypothetical protein
MSIGYPEEALYHAPDGMGFGCLHLEFDDLETSDLETSDLEEESQ